MHAPAPASGLADPRRFLLRRLHSLCGVLPIGVFLAVHLWTNLQAVRGRDAFRHAVGEIQSIPGLALIELVAIIAPLAFHAFYGLVIAAQARFNVQRYGYTRNWLFLLQRASGLVAFAFLIVHLGQFRVAKLLGSARWEAFYDRLALGLDAPGMYALYLIGVTASVFHFANGLWTASQTWGLASSDRARRRSAVAFALLGVALWLVGVDTLLHFFYRCGGMLPWPGLDRDALCRDADMLRAVVDLPRAPL
jgi:succinate dehydrogenase/fumarate reductase cytochrome b subunit (b558 family)